MKLICNDDKTYEESLSNNNACFLQSIKWANSKNLPYINYIVKTDSDDVVMTCLVLIQKKYGFRYLYIPRGIKFKNTESINKEAIDLIIKDLKRKFKVTLLIIDPDTDLLDSDKYNQRLKIVLKSLGFIGKKLYSYQPHETNIINLENKDILTTFEYTERTRVKRAIKDGYSYYIAKDSEFKQFYSIIEEFKIKKYAIKDYDYYFNIYNNFKGNSELILIKNINGILIGGYFNIFFNNVLYELYGGCSPSKRDSNSTSYLKYVSMLEAQKKGLKYYDQWGATNEPSSYLFKFTSFKKNFGGYFIKFLPSQYKIII